MAETGGTLVDSNVLLDLLTEDSRWFEWSARMTEDAAGRGFLAINPIIFAEVAAGFEFIETLEEALPQSFFKRLDLPWIAAFVAGQCFRKYRRRGGEKRSPMPDFYIGAHAAVENMSLLTRDGQRYKTYFPRLRLISP